MLSYVQIYVIMMAFQMPWHLNFVEGFFFFPALCITLFIDHSLSFHCGLIQYALETIWSDYGALRSGWLLQKTGISERYAFLSISADVWSLQRVAMIREKHFSWNSFLGEYSDLRLAGCWFISSFPEEVVFTECASGWCLGLKRFIFSSEYVNIKLRWLWNKPHSQ